MNTEVKCESFTASPDIKIPEAFALHQNYPNPFNPTTTIPFALPTESKVKIEVFNLLGQRVAILEDGVMQAGHHKIAWSGNSISGLSLASGIYIVKFSAEGTVVNTKYENINKMLLLK